jgi:hypothetical protein
MHKSPIPYDFQLLYLSHFAKTKGLRIAGEFKTTGLLTSFHQKFAMDALEINNICKNQVKS